MKNQNTNQAVKSIVDNYMMQAGSEGVQGAIKSCEAFLQKNQHKAEFMWATTKNGDFGLSDDPMEYNDDMYTYNQRVEQLRKHRDHVMALQDLKEMAS